MITALCFFSPLTETVWFPAAVSIAWACQ